MKPFILLLVLILAGCTGKKESQNELKLVLSNEVSTLDPGACFDQVCQAIVNTLYEGLYEYEYLKRPYQLRPLLAAEMPRVEENGLKVTIKLKQNIAYHPQPFLGAKRVMKSEDVVNAIKRQAFQGTKGQGWWLFEKRIVGLDEWRAKVGTDLDAFFKESVPGLQTPDHHTIVIKLTKPFPQLAYGLAMNFASPIPAEAIRELKNDLNSVEVGTGAFKLTNYNPNQQAVLERFAGYATSAYPSQGDRIANEGDMLADAGKSLPFLDRVVFLIQKEQQTSWLNFMAGKIDILVLTKDYYQAALTSEGKLTPELVAKKMKIQIAPTLIYWWLAFNMQDPVVGKNLKLREAIAHGVDVEKFIKLFTNNVGQKANSIYPPGIPGYNPSAELPYKYDLAKAKQLLAQAGYPDGKGLPELTFDVRGSSTLNRQIAEFVVQEIGVMGIKAKINSNTFPVFLERSRRGELQFWHGGWVLDYPDAENILQLLATSNFPPGPNSTLYSNKKVDALFEKIRYMEEGDQKHALMAQVEVEVNKDLPWVMLFYTRNYVLTQDKVLNYRYSDIVSNYLKYVKIDQRP